MEIRYIIFMYQKVEDIRLNISNFLRDNKSIFITSSFQTHSIPLLKVINEILPNVPIYFIDTTYHFKETLEYRDLICAMFNFNLKTIKPTLTENNLYEKSIDLCCSKNKINPLEPIKAKYDVWINGLRRTQTENRKTLSVIEKNGNLIIYRPILDWTETDIKYYLNLYKIPNHPLLKKGYYSIGCEPCTVKTLENNRNGRWEGTNKTECGLHFKDII